MGRKLFVWVCQFEFARWNGIWQNGKKITEKNDPFSYNIVYLATRIFCDFQVRRAESLNAPSRRAAFPLEFRTLDCIGKVQWTSQLSVLTGLFSSKHMIGPARGVAIHKISWKKCQWADQMYYFLFCTSPRSLWRWEQMNCQFFCGALVATSHAEPFLGFSAMGRILRETSQQTLNLKYVGGIIPPYTIFLAIRATTRL